MRPTATERVGGTLRRPAHARSDFVRRVLEHVRAAGFAGAPLALGVDADRRQVFEWIEGDVPDTSPFHLTIEQQVEGARLIRGFHDAASTLPGLGSETVSHGDLGPHNTVFRDATPVALIDWDEDVRPGPRAPDFAQAVWGFADLLEDVPLALQRDGLHAMCAAYGGITPTIVLDELAARFERARADHLAHGRTAAVRAFDRLSGRLAADRDALLGRPCA